MKIKGHIFHCIHVFFLISGGYKGFGLAMMVDVFCGILSGSEFGTNIKRWQGEEERVQNLVTIWNWFQLAFESLKWGSYVFLFFFFLRQGQCFVAINPKVYADGFEDRMQALMDQYRNLEPVSMWYVALTGMMEEEIKCKTPEKGRGGGLITHTDRHA